MSYPALAEGLSPKAAELLKQLFESGDSQSYGVADCLNTIAENGNEYCSDQHLICCAGEIVEAAKSFAEQLMLSTADDEPVTPEIVWNSLVLADVHVPMGELREWPQEWLDTAANWAAAVHDRAGDNDDVEVPECPFYVHPSETDKGLAFPNGRSFKPLDREDANTWMAVVGEHVVAHVDLPTCFKRADAMRFLYFLHKDKLKAKEWTV